MTGTAAAAQSWSTASTDPMTPRSGIETTATTSAATHRCASHSRTPRAGSAAPSATAWLTARAVAICSAEPPTISTMKAEISTASEP